LDVDAVSQSAYLDEKMAPYYHAYYQSILMSIQHTMKVQRRYPLILCFRAHHDFEDIIYVSTLNGETVAGISERGECGDVRFTNEGLNARLEAGKYNVLPANAYQRDHTEHRAGNLVRTFGRDHHWSTDAFDMICPETMVIVLHFCFVCLHAVCSAGLTLCALELIAYFASQSPFTL
jgi:hypothetical protein